MAEGRLQFLVVEDDEDDFFLIRHLLQSGVEGADVERAATVDDALQRTARTPYDVFLLDYRLGDKDGLELLRELKHRDAAAPVIFLTGHGDEEIAVQAMKAGATDYLPKSKLSEPSLNMAVRYAMALRHKEEAVRTARRALHASERRFRALVENSSDVVLLLDAEGTILYISQSVRRMLGFMPAEVLETCAFDYLHADDLAVVKQLFTSALQSPGAPFWCEYRCQHKDGGWRVLEGTMTNHLQEPAVGAVVVNERDVTERRQAEEALRVSEHEYRALFENANDAIVIFEPEEETILEANPQACAMYGFARDELLGMSLKQISQDVKRGEQAVSQTLTEGSLRDFETVHYRKDGSPLYILANASVINYRGLQAVLSISRDISERKLAEREIFRLNRALQAQSKCGEVVLQARDEQQLLDEICKIVVQVGGYRMAWVAGPGEAADVMLRPLARAGYDQGYLDAVAGLQEHVRRELPVSVVLRHGQALVCRDIAADPRFTELASKCADRGYASMIALPLLIDQVIFAALVIYAAEKNAFDDAEVELLRELAANLAYGIGSLRARTQRAAAEAESRKLHSAVEQSADVVVITNREGLIEYVNPAFETLTGYSRAEAIGKTPRLLKSGRHDTACYQQLWRTILAGQVYRAVLINRKKDGHLYHAEKTITPVLDQHGNISHFISNDRDITERILREQERQLAEEELRASERKYRTLVETANEGIWALDAEDRTTFVNAKMAAMLGYEPAQILTRPVYDFLLDRAKAQRALACLRAGIRQQADTVLLRQDGSQLFAILNSNPIYDAAGKYAGALAMMTDITDRRALEEQLRHAQKMEAVGQLAGGVAHDFNNLLMVISSYSELLMDSLHNDPKAQRQAEQILKAGRRAAVLTRQLLAFSRKQVLSPRLLDLNTVLADFGRMLPRLIGEDIDVVMQPGEGLWKVMADPVQIEQVLMNLALNARDAMPQGGRLTLETTNMVLDEEYTRRHAAVPSGEYVMIAVVDTGCGIAPANLPRIFEPFFTTKEQGKGTGLGLPTVYGIVKQSGGFVWVYSEVGKGTAFKVYLPRADQQADAPLLAVPEPAPRGSETILLVEDEEAVRESAGEFLALRGYTILQAKDGSDALQVLEHYPASVDLLVTDVIMPVMSGRELASRIAQAYPKIRVLFISGYTEAMVERQGIGPGSAFLQKPFTLSVLGRKVREVLDHPAKQLPPLPPGPAKAGAVGTSDDAGCSGPGSP